MQCIRSESRIHHVSNDIQFRHINQTIFSGVTEQHGALSNLGIQGPPEAAHKSTKVCQISNAKLSKLKWSFYRQKTSPAHHRRVYGSFISEGTMAQETYWR